jgi:hypothetical protein
MKKNPILISTLGVFFLVASLSAQTWTASKILTHNSGSSEDPAVAVDSSNHIHVVWEDDTSGKDQIYYKRSTDGGVTWTTKRLTWVSGDSINPDIAVDSNNHLHVVLSDDSRDSNDEIYYKRSKDGGATWSKNKRLTWSYSVSDNPAITVDSSNNLHVVYEDWVSSNFEINYKKSTDGGKSWTTERLSWTSGWSYYAAIATDSNNHIHVVWNDDTPGNEEIYYKKSTDGGSTWQNKRLTYTSGISYFPAIAVDVNNHIHVVWQDYTPGTADIFYKKSTNGGIYWAKKRLTYNPSNSYAPSVSVDSNNYIHVVWYDPAPGNWEIYYKKSTNGGTNWATKRLTWTSGYSYLPDIAVGSNHHIHVVWQDETTGNFEIYYRMGIQ